MIQLENNSELNTLVELPENIRKVIGAKLVRENSFTPWGEDQKKATELWRLGHKLMGTPGFDK